MKNIIWIAFCISTIFGIAAATSLTADDGMAQSQGAQAVTPTPVPAINPPIIGATPQAAATPYPLLTATMQPMPGINPPIIGATPQATATQNPPIVTPTPQPTPVQNPPQH